MDFFVYGYDVYILYICKVWLVSLLLNSCLLVALFSINEFDLLYKCSSWQFVDLARTSWKFPSGFHETWSSSPRVFCYYSKGPVSLKTLPSSAPERLFRIRKPPDYSKKLFSNEFDVSFRNSVSVYNKQLIYCGRGMWHGSLKIQCKAMPIRRYVWYSLGVL